VSRYDDGCVTREVVVQGGRGSRRRLLLLVDDQPLEVEVERLGPATFLRRDGDRVETFHCVRDGRAIHLSWRGRTYRIEECDEEAPAVQRGGHAGLEAPMPGKVIALRVEPGQRVARGEEVLVVEAMKMENALRAPRDGVVVAIHVAVGDAVGPGRVLVELD
jgi:3-methylcrotonyl-CoA carboxylase alpha subunit